MIVVMTMMTHQSKVITISAIFETPQLQMTHIAHPTTVAWLENLFSVVF
jgi:hypothetical protein